MASPSTWVPNFVHSTHRANTGDENEEGVLLVPQPRSDANSRNIQDEITFSSDRTLPIGRVPMLVMSNRPAITPQEVESMRRKLRFYFMNPIEKWKARRQFPWKLLLQVIKIVIVTTQLTMFGNARYAHMNFYEDNRIALCNIFLKNWDSSYEVETYPPNQGPYALYTKDEFYQHIDHVVVRYATLRQVAIGSYDYLHENLTSSPLTICKKYYKKAVIFGFNESFIFDGSPEELCLDIALDEPISNGSTPQFTFDSKQYFAQNNFTVLFDRLISLEIKFALRYVLLKAMGPMDSPDCYQLDVKVVLDNMNRDGGIRAALRVDHLRKRCYYIKNADLIDECNKHACMLDAGKVAFSDPRDDVAYSLEIALLNVLNGLVIFLCFLSCILCSRAIIRAQTLGKEAVLFFRNHFGRNLAPHDRCEFFNLWYFTIIINDVLIIAGSILKIEIENKTTDGDFYNVCSIFLGSGSLLVWFGVIRYLGFFRTYNVIILTFKKALPDVFRFLLCAILMYAGFVFCGWLVFGPYHIKFRSLSSTAECLFSLINGDDMFATFTILSAKSGLVWWYSRVYMYGFISLFIYVVLSLFIAVIMDSYETIKLSYEHGFPKSDLLEFAYECQDDINSGIFRQDSVDPWGHFRRWVGSFFTRGTSDERQPLLHGGN